MFCANLLKCWNDLSQGVRDFPFVLEIQVCSWPARGPSKHSQRKLNPLQSVGGARLRVQEPAFDRNRHSRERLTKDFLHFMIIGHRVESSNTVLPLD
jgi:hypothetical protein